MIGLLLTLPILLSGQNPSYEQYQVKDGLPSAEVYDVLCDSKGYIWASTDRGVSRYNGYEFENFTTADGLTNNTNFRIYEDHQGRIWFLAYDKTICYFQNDRFYPHPLNDKIIAIPQLAFWWEEIYVASDNSIYLYESDADFSKLGGYLLIDSSWQNFEILKVEEFEKDSIEINNHSIDYASRLGHFFIRQISSQGQERISVFPKVKKNYDSITILHYASSYWTPKDTNYIVSLIDNRIAEKYVTNDIIQHKFIEGNRIFVSTSRGLKILDKQTLKVQHSYFEGLNISKTTIDKEGNYWIASIDKGLLKIPNLGAITLEHLNNGEEIRQVSSIETLGEYLLFHTSTKKTILFNSALQDKTLASYQNFIPRAFSKYKNSLTLGYDEILRLTDSGYVLERLSNRIPIKNRVFLNDSLCIVQSNTSIGKVKMDLPKNIVYYPFEYVHHFEKSSIDLICFGDSKCYSALLSELYYFDFDENIVQKLPFNKSQLPIRINDLAYSASNILFIATLGHGLYYLQNGQFQRFTTDQGIASEFINKLYLENDSTLWLGTNKGTDRINFSIAKDRILLEDIKNFSTGDGLNSDYVNCLVAWNGKMVAGTDQGLSIFEPDNIQKEFSAPDLAINRMEVNGQIIPLDSVKKFQHFEHNIAFHFTANTMRKFEGLDRYHYRLLEKGNDTTWTSTDIRKIQFSNLKPGQYTFEIKASNTTGTKFSSIKSIPFDIQPHFTESKWFKWLLFLIGALVVYLLFLSRLAAIKRKSAIEKIEQKYLLEVNAAQLAALRSQMNPHFIFNSLNSIQNFIFKNDVRQANHFLTKFSRLIRESLVLSKLDLIPLEQELKFLMDYLELEQMRFPGVFDFEIKVDEAMEKDEIMLPPLLIQPLLENSIRHGFKGLEHKGLLSIKIDADDTMLFMTIVDNGIGMAEAQKEKNPNSKHISFATNILTNRIQLINERSTGALATFDISEKINAAGKVSGVVAKIILPQNLI